jgi:integrase
MIQIDPKGLSTAFVKPGTPTFADLLTRLPEQPDLPPTRRRDFASGLRRVPKAIGLRPEDVPADPAWLQPRIRQVAPAAIGLSAKSWSNAQSDVRSALAHFGLLKRRLNRADDLAPDWRELWDAVLAAKDRTLKIHLCRFVYFLNSVGVAPTLVTTEHAAAFLAAVTENEIRKSPKSICRNAVWCWNLAVKRFPIWPRQTLAQPWVSNRIKLPLDDFPASFALDLEAFAESQLRPDRLDDDANLRPLRAITVKDYRERLTRFASVLVHAGVPIGDLQDLAALVTKENAELGLRWLLARNGGPSSIGIAEMSVLLKTVARRHIRAPEADQKAIDRLAKRLAVKKQPGMTTKNRDRLRPLLDSATLGRLLRLPEQLFQRADAADDPKVAALEREDAIAIAILLTFPIRLQNLRSIRLDVHLQRPNDRSAFIVFSAAEIKNSQHIEFELPEDKIRMIDRHLATRSPLLCPFGTPWLFPLRTGGGPINRDYLAVRIKKRILREVGVAMNPHLFRHLGATLLLRAHPGAYETARHLLGHTRLSSTLNAYAGFQTGAATRIFSEVIRAASQK